MTEPVAAADPAPTTELEDAWEMFRKQMRDDPEYAWSWHCNLAVPIMDAIGVGHQAANEAAAHLMSYLFEYDITTHPRFKYGKTSAQQCHEMRLAIDREEDAQIASASAAIPQGDF